jgi:hypothetical protein
MRARITKSVRANLLNLACWAALVTSTPGCAPGGGDAVTPAFVPSWPEARQALESSLSAWCVAPSPVPASFDVPGVQFVDKTRKPDDGLLSFQILAQMDIENARQFTVRLNLKGEEAPQLVKYNVIGRDPVWVFRLDDYEMFSHWEHDMSPPARAEQPKNSEQRPKTN